MIVDQVRHRCAGETCELSARVRSEVWEREEFTLWYRLPASLAPDHDAQPDCSPFVVALLLWCLRRGETLTMDGPVSPRLLNAIPRSTDILRAFWPDLITPVDVSAQPHPPTPTGKGVGSFFTRGVDSWYTAFTYGRRAYDSGTLTSLIYVPSVDFMYDEEHAKHAVRATEEAALSIGKNPVVVETNLRFHTERFLHWGHYHGAGLASVGLALGLDEIVLPAARSYRFLVPEGAHPLVDPLWSTERTSVVHHGAEATRWDKIAELRSRPEILGTLKVCFDENTDGNCGRCPKCLVTMVMLEAAGVLEQCWFDVPLEPRLLARLEVPDVIFEMLRSQVLPQLQDASLRRALQSAVLRLRLRTIVEDGRGALRLATTGRRTRELHGLLQRVKLAAARLYRPGGSNRRSEVKAR